MARSFSIPLTTELDTEGLNNEPAWGLIPWDAVRNELPQAEGWQHEWHPETTEKYRRIRIVVSRGLFRGAHIKLTRRHDDPSTLRASVGRHAAIHPSLAGGLAFLCGLGAFFIGIAVRVFEGKEGGILIQHIPVIALIAGGAGFVAVWPLTWLLTRFTGLKFGQAKRIATAIRTGLTDEDLVAERAAILQKNVQDSVWRIEFDDFDQLDDVETWMLPLLFPHGGLLALLATCPHPANSDTRLGWYRVENPADPGVNAMLSRWFNRGQFEFTAVNPDTGDERTITADLIDAQIAAYNSVVEYNQALEGYDPDAAIGEWSLAFEEARDRLGNSVDIIFDIHDGLACDANVADDEPQATDSPENTGN